FFLMICESFVLRGKDFRLPGLGSYMSVAINRGDTQAIVAGALTMLALIMLLEIFLWRPLMSWAARFKWEGADQPHRSRGIFLYRVLKRSAIFDKLMEKFLSCINRRIAHDFTGGNRSVPHLPLGERVGVRVISFISLAAFIIFSLFGFVLLIALLVSMPAARWGTIFESAGLTALRVFLSLFLASLWTIPVGILIGYFPRVTRIAQPLVQIAAAFPMPMLFPLILLGLHWFGIGMGIGSILLLTLALQWYLLFNTIAGASFVPEGFKDLAQVYRLKPRLMVKKIILPALFPFLVTGWITGAGGAWNAAIVAEYVYYKGDIFMTKGLGSLMSRSAANGDYAVLA
ncbi:MAG: ABC transporter permease subunit, partial [bacterium]|nr:ABC transporter permease subunit [bacterium]